MGPGSPSHREALPALPACCPLGSRRRPAHTGPPRPCHGTELGLGSRTGQAGSELCFLGSQPGRMPSGFRVVRRVAEQTAAATLSRLTPGPGRAGTPCFWSLGQSIAGGTPALSPFPQPPELTVLCGGEEGHDLRPRGHDPLYLRTARIHARLFHHKHILSPLLG